MESDGGGKSCARSKLSSSKNKPTKCVKITQKKRATTKLAAKTVKYIYESLIKLHFRNSKVKQRLALKTTHSMIQQHIQSTINITPDEVAQELAKNWFTKTWINYPHNSIYAILLSTGFKSKTALELAKVLTPFKTNGSSYSTHHLFDFAIEYLKGKYDPIGAIGQSHLFHHPVQDEWFTDERHPNVHFVNMHAPLSLNEEHMRALTIHPRLQQTPNTRIFYHGTNWGGSLSILERINHVFGRKCLDFGILNSFYCTPHLSDALQWCEKHRDGWKSELCIVAFRVPYPLPFNTKIFKDVDAEWRKLVKDSRLCKQRINDLDRYDFVYGPMCANPIPIQRKNATAVPHRPTMKFQLCSKTDRADEYLQQCMTCIAFFPKM
jgi:hypothetical protein